MFEIAETDRYNFDISPGVVDIPHIAALLRDLFCRRKSLCFIPCFATLADYGISFYDIVRLNEFRDAYLEIDRVGDISLLGDPPDAASENKTPCGYAYLGFWPFFATYKGGIQPPNYTDLISATFAAMCPFFRVSQLKSSRYTAK